MRLFKNGKRNENPYFNKKFYSFLYDTVTFYLRGLTNVDGGNLGIATEWLSNCLDCEDTYFIEPCKKCGRHANNYVNFRAGRGDGLYPVFSLLINDKSIGSLIMFDSETVQESIGDIFSHYISKLEEYQAEEELTDGFDEVNIILENIFDTYQEDIPIYRLSKLTVDKKYSYSNQDIESSGGYFVVGESGEGLSSLSAMVTVTTLESGSYDVYLIGDREPNNNKILKPKLALILKSEWAENLGLSSDVIPTLSIQEELTRWNKSAVASYFGGDLNKRAFTSNSIYFLALSRLAEFNDDYAESLKILALTAASWLMMLNKVSTDIDLERFIDDILKMNKMDRILIYELRGQDFKSPEKLRKMALSSDGEIRELAARDPESSIELLKLLSSDNDWAVRRAVVENPKTPIELLVNFANDEDEYIRMRVAENPNVPEETLQDLAQDNDDDVRKAVAVNPSTSSSILKILARDEFDQVREYVTLHENFPEDLIPIMANDDSKLVRKSIAENIKTSPQLLEELSQDPDPEVQIAVSMNENLPTQLLPMITKNLLPMMATSEDLYVRCEVAINPNTPPNLLISLAKDSVARVRRAVAENPNTPHEVLQELAKEEDIYVKRGVAENPSTPIQILLELANDKRLIRNLKRNPKSNSNTELISILDQEQ